MLEIERKISKQDKLLLEEWVIMYSVAGQSLQLSGLTYQQILDKAKQEQQEKKRKIESFLWL